MHFVQETTEKLGFEALAVFSEALIETADLASDVFEDGKVGLEDISQVLRVGAIVADIRKAPQAVKEIIDLDKEEFDALQARLRAFVLARKDDLGNDKAEEIALNVITGAAQVILAISKFL